MKVELVQHSISLATLSQLFTLRVECSMEIALQILHSRLFARHILERGKKTAVLLLTMDNTALARWMRQLVKMGELELSNAITNKVLGSQPVELKAGDYHLPFLGQESRPHDSARIQQLISLGRLVADTVLDEDEALSAAYACLASDNVVWAEHIAMAYPVSQKFDCFVGWRPLRAEIEANGPGLRFWEGVMQEEGHTGQLH